MDVTRRYEEGGKVPWEGIVNAVGQIAPILISNAKSDACAKSCRIKCRGECGAFQFKCKNECKKKCKAECVSKGGDETKTLNMWMIFGIFMLAAVLAIIVIWMLKKR